MNKNVAKKTHKLKNISIKENGVRLDINMRRFENNLNNAQYLLDKAVMTSMMPLMPKDDGVFIDDTVAKSDSVAGTGIVYAAFGDQGRYLYEGKTMVDEKTGSPWARKGARKVLVSQYGGKTNAKENLTYSRAEARPQWFEAAKERDLDQWLKIAKGEMGKE